MQLASCVLPQFKFDLNLKGILNSNTNSASFCNLLTLTLLWSNIFKNIKYVYKKCLSRDVLADRVECANINNYHVLSHQLTANSIDAAHAPYAQCYWFLLGVKGRAGIDPWDSLTAPKGPAPDKSMTPQCTTYTLWLFTGHEAKPNFITCLSGAAELSKIHITASEKN